LLFVLSGADADAAATESRPVTVSGKDKGKKGGKEAPVAEDTGPQGLTFVVGNLSVPRLSALELGGQFGKLRHRLQEEAATGRTAEQQTANSVRFRELLGGLQAVLVPSSEGQAEADVDCSLLTVSVVEQLLDITVRGGASFVNMPLWCMLKRLLSPAAPIAEAAAPAAIDVSTEQASLADA
jgi:hypothetical protein